MTSDEARTARLLFGVELANGRIQSSDLEHPAVQRAVRSGAIPTRLRRTLQRGAQKAGLASYEKRCLKPFMAARRAVLGSDADGAPRVLVRVDEFPHARSFDEQSRYGAERFERFHAIMAEAGVPYLLAVTPRLSRDYLNPDAAGGRAMSPRETDLLDRVVADGVELGLHGLDHRTRDARPRRRSELAGRSAPELTELLDSAQSALADFKQGWRVFIPPFNRFDAEQWELLAGRYEVVCGGPETVAIVGFQPTPVWRHGALYMPAYPPLYGRARDVDQALRRIVRGRASLWVPVVLHWGWEADAGFGELQELASLLAGYAAPWREFLALARTIARVG